MKNSAVQFAFGFLAIILFAGAEEMLPHFLGVGFPLLLAAVQFFAVRCTPVAMAILALAAGGAEDALSSLPTMTSVSYFLIVAVFTRWSGLPRAAAVLTYPCYQLWLLAWVSALGGGIFGRLLVSVPIGLATAAATWTALSWLAERASIDEIE